MSELPVKVFERIVDERIAAGGRFAAMLELIFVKATTAASGVGKRAMNSPSTTFRRNVALLSRGAAQTARVCRAVHECALRDLQYAVVNS